MRAGRTWPRSISLCAAALALLQLGGMLHLAAAPHGVCWEHGVVVDLESSSGGHELALAPAREGLERGAVPRARSDAHPHCPALWVLHEARPAVAVTTPALACPPEVRSGGVPGVVPAPAGREFRCAPKQSPPV